MRRRDGTNVTMLPMALQAALARAAAAVRRADHPPPTAARHPMVVPRHHTEAAVHLAVTE